MQILNRRVSLGSHCSVRAEFLRSLLAPQRLAPVIVLHLVVGFMQALAGAPGVSSRRGHFVGARVHGSMEVRGGGGGAVAVGQSSRSGLHLCGHWPRQGGGGGGSWVHCTGGGSSGCGVARGEGVVRGRRWQWVRVALFIGWGFMMSLVVLTVEVLHRAPALPARWGVMTRPGSRGRALQRGRLRREVSWSGGPALGPGGRRRGRLSHHRGVGDVRARRGRGLRQLTTTSARGTRPRRRGHWTTTHRTTALSVGEALSALAGGARPAALSLPVSGVSVSEVATVSAPVPAVASLSVGDVALLVHGAAVVVVMVVVMLAILGASPVSVLGENLGRLGELHTSFRVGVAAQGPLGRPMAPLPSSVAVPAPPLLWHLVHVLLLSPPVPLPSA